MELYAGLDLHSRNTYIGILDQNLKRVFKKRVINKLEIILETLDPFRVEDWGQPLTLDIYPKSSLREDVGSKNVSVDYFCPRPLEWIFVIFPHFRFVLLNQFYVFFIKLSCLRAA